MKGQHRIWDYLYLQGLSWKKETIRIKTAIKNKKIFELGVGNGKTLKAILNQNPKKVIAIDISGEAIKKSREKIKSDKVLYIKYDILDFKTGEKFDVIACYYFLNNFIESKRKLVIKKIKGLLSKDGTIIFEDFAIGDFRQRGKEIEKNTVEKQNKIICHFFDKKEIKRLFKDFNILKIEEKTFNPIRKDKSVQRKILKAIIKNKRSRQDLNLEPLP